MPNRIMSSSTKTENNLSRQNLRMDPRILGALDLARSKRGGFVSRNTWILEAILEKLAREKKGPGADGGEGKIHFL